MTARARSGMTQDWRPETFLLADAVDVLSQLLWIQIELHTDKGAHNPRPEPVVRPWAVYTPHTDIEPRAMTPVTELAAFVAARGRRV